MCLSVYLGTTRPLSVSAPQPGELGMEVANWTPPPLNRSEFVYYLGRVPDNPTRTAQSPTLECSCLLAEYVEWTETGPVVRRDESYASEVRAFDALRQLCDEATRDGGMATIVCDDSGGVEQDCAEEDYGTGMWTRLASIARGNLLFADVSGGFPWRVYHVVR